MFELLYFKLCLCVFLCGYFIFYLLEMDLWSEKISPDVDVCVLAHVWTIDLINLFVFFLDSLLLSFLIDGLTEVIRSDTSSCARVFGQLYLLICCSLFMPGHFVRHFWLIICVDHLLSWVCTFVYSLEYI
jgi:hypothetical protein